MSDTANRALLMLAALTFARVVAVVGQAVALADAVTMLVVGGANINGTRWSIAIGGLVIAVAARALVAWAAEVVSRRAAAGTKEELRAAASRVVLSRPANGPVGGIVALLSHGLDDLDEWFTGYLPAMLGAVIAPPMVIGWLLIVDWPSGAIAIATLPLIPVFMILIGRFTQERTSAATDALARLADHVVELAAGLPVLVGLGRAREYAKALVAVGDRHRRRTMETLRLAFLSALALELIATLSVALVAVTAGLRMLDGQLGLGTGLLVLVLVPECFLPMRTLGAAYHSSTAGLEALRRTEEILAAPATEIDRADSMVPMEDGRYRLASGLTVWWPDRDEAAVREFDLSARTGEIVAVIGSSGAGKSTAVAMVAGALEAPVAEWTGEVCLIPPRELAYAAQHPYTTERSVFAEITFALTPMDVESAAGERLARRAVVALGMARLTDRHPLELSPGELRLVAVARVLVRVWAGARFAILDEPTAHLDRRSARRVRRLLAELTSRAAVVVASHDRDLITCADRVVHVGPASRTASESTAVTTFNEFSRDFPETSVPDVSAVNPPDESEPTRRPSTVESGAGDFRSNDSVSPDSRGLARLGIGLVRSGIGRLIGAVLLGAGSLAAGIALTGTSAWLIAKAAQGPPVLTLMVAIVGVRFFGLARAGLRYVERLSGHDVVLRLTTTIRTRLWNALAAAGPTRQRELRYGNPLSALVSDIDVLTAGLLRVVLPPLVAVVTIVVGVIFAGVLVPGGAWLAIPAAFTAIGAPALAWWADRNSSVRTIDARQNLVRELATALPAGPQSRAHGLIDGLVDRLARLDRSVAVLLRRTAWAEGAAGALVVAGTGVTSLLGLLIGASAVAAGQLPPVAAGVLALAPLGLADVLLPLVTAGRQAPELWACLGRLRAVLTVGESATEAAPAEPVGEIDRLPVRRLRLTGISAGWPSRPGWSVGPIDADVHTGQWLAVTGPSGSGKSTILAVLLGFLRPYDGTYRLSDVDTSRLSPERVRNHLTWCPQRATLFSATLRANLMLGSTPGAPPTDDDLAEILHRVGLGPLLNRMPAGLDTWVGADGMALSGGERQRVAVARALLASGDVVLLDEPTAHLDTETGDALLADLRRALADRIVVLVTHDRRHAAGCDQTIDLATDMAIDPAIDRAPAANVSGDDPNPRASAPPVPIPRRAR